LSNQLPTNLRLRDLILPGLIFTTLIMVPYLVGWLAAPAGMQFSGALANHNDFPAYIAAIRQGAAGEWLFHFNFSPEPWQPKLMLPLYMLTGKIAGVLGGGHVLWFHLLRLAAIVVTLLGFRFWLVTVFPGRRRTQLTALIFLLFGGGLGWLLYPLLATTVSGFTLFPDLSGSEWTATLIGLNAPHYLLGLGLQALVFGALLRLVRARTTRSAILWALGGMAAALALGLVYVYQTAVIGTVTGVYLLVLAVRKGRIPWRTWLLGGLVLAPLPGPVKTTCPPSTGSVKLLP